MQPLGSVHENVHMVGFVFVRCSLASPGRLPQNFRERASRVLVIVLWSRQILKAPNCLQTFVFSRPQIWSRLKPYCHSAITVMKVKVLTENSVVLIADLFCGCFGHFWLGMQTTPPFLASCPKNAPKQFA